MNRLNISRRDAATSRSRFAAVLSRFDSACIPTVDRMADILARQLVLVADMEEK